MKNTVRVFDTITKKVVEVEVSEKFALISKEQSGLSKITSERNLIIMLFFENKTERECAEILCTSQQHTHKNKKLILCKLYKLLKIK